MNFKERERERESKQTYDCSIMHMGIRLLASEYFPEDNTKGENINLQVR